jgi:GAF domain-containing protein
MPREAVLVRTLVGLAANLVNDFDIIDVVTTLCERCVDTFDVGAAGVMLAAPDGHLRVAASSSDAMRLLELFELQTNEGPCVDCHRTGKPIVNLDLPPDDRWAHFSARAVADGFRSAHALPIRLRNHIIGAVNMLRTDTAALNQQDVDAAQALAESPPLPSPGTTLLPTPGSRTR